MPVAAPSARVKLKLLAVAKTSAVWKILSCNHISHFSLSLPPSCYHAHSRSSIMFLRFISHSCSRLQTFFSSNMQEEWLHSSRQQWCVSLSRATSKNAAENCRRREVAVKFVLNHELPCKRSKKHTEEREKEKIRIIFTFFSLSLWLMNNYRRRCRCRFGILLPSICCAVCCAIAIGATRGEEGFIFSVKWVKNNELSHTTTRWLRRAHDGSALRFNFNENFSRRLSINIILHFNAKYPSTFHFS